MAKLRRLEFTGAFYHVTSCGNRRETVFTLMIAARLCVSFRRSV